MAERRPKIGDVFEIDLGSDSKAYMQYIANDATQLGSEVIRVFETRYAVDDLPDPREIVDGTVEFHAHAFVHLGAKEGLWSKVGNVQNLGKLDVLFRDTDDYGNPEVAVSEKWYVWKIGKRIKAVGKLTGRYQEAEIGVVIPAEYVVERIQMGEYQFVYPGY